MNDQACPRCKSTKYRDPSLKLMVNVCGHTLCDQCVDLLFLKGSGSCPQCFVPLRRNNFRIQHFEDSMVEKEMDIRRRLLRDYNKKEEDFETLEEYNDYLERVETMIFNLYNNIDVININKEIEAYKRENREIIQRNRTRLGRAESELEAQIQQELIQTEARQKELAEYELEQKKIKAREKHAFIEKLMTSSKDANLIVTEFIEKAEKLRKEEKHVPAPKPIEPEFSSGIKIGKSREHMFLPVPKGDTGVPYIYVPPVRDVEGPVPPTTSVIEKLGYMKHVRPETTAELAAGYRATMACERALQEAFEGLYYCPQKIE